MECIHSFLAELQVWSTELESRLLNYLSLAMRCLDQRCFSCHYPTILVLPSNFPFWDFTVAIGDVLQNIPSLICYAMFDVLQFLNVLGLSHSSLRCRIRLL